MMKKNNFYILLVSGAIGLGIFLTLWLMVYLLQNHPFLVGKIILAFIFLFLGWFVTIGLDLEIKINNYLSSKKKDKVG